MQGDGNGWVQCACGRVHWGRCGAAGLLVTSTTGTGDTVALLQKRAGWTHNGGTWALPGGARDSHEDAVTAAMRETGEETSLDLAAITVYDELVDDHGPWSYTTVLVHHPRPDDVASINDESDEMRWQPVDAVDDLPLHHGFAAAWPHLRQRIAAPRATGDL